MAKRFTDSEKWKRAWFAELPTFAKLVWLYVTDDCDSNGFWHGNFKRMAYDLGDPVPQDAFDRWFESKMLKLADDKYFIPSFVEFQYGPKLSDLNKAHKPVIRELEKFGIPIQAPYQPLRSPFVAPSMDLARGPKGGPGVGEEEEVGVGAGVGEGDKGPFDENSHSVVTYQLDTLIARALKRGSA